MPLTTRCRHCGRLFPVYAQQIKARGGKVECPQCGQRFAAIRGLLDEQIPASEIGHGRRSRANKRRASPVSPMVAALDAPARHSTRLRGLGWLLGVLILTAGLIGQAAWWQRGAWMERTQLWSELERVCNSLGCTLPLPRLADSIEILRPALAERPGDNALQLSLTLLNRAGVAQRLPLLQLEVYDEAGRLLSARRMSPEEYAARQELRQGIAPGQTADVTLAIAALGRLPAGFRVRLF
jgi:predicted Zn finger-like uncharacterized protein